MTKFRGYDLLNPSMVLPAVVNVANHFDPAALARGDRLAQAEPLHDVLQGAIDWLITQHQLELGDELVWATDSGRALFADVDQIASLVADYEDLADSVANMAGITDQGSAALPPVFLTTEPSEHALDALLPAALTFLHERSSSQDPLLSLGKKLSDDPLDLNSEDLSDVDPASLARLFDALKARGVIDLPGDQIARLTDKGRILLSLGGYAELILSYYKVFQHLNKLSDGQWKYGLWGDVNRAGELNARASNGILELRVAPHIIELVSASPVIGEIFGDRQGRAVDFGSGGGVLTQAILSCARISKAYGADINPEAVQEARALAEARGLSRQDIEFLEGSIADREFMAELGRLVRDGGPLVASINFILHDIGEGLSREFLSHYAEAFGDTPLIITESFRLPEGAMAEHPDYQASSFKFMHDISGQQLYYKDEFEHLLTGAGYEIIDEQSHSSARWASQAKNFITIATYVVRARNSGNADQ